MFKTNQNMQSELKGMYDNIEFVRNPDSNLYESCLGDDTDSLIGCSLLKDVAGIEVGGFYNFSNIFLSENKNYDKSMIGVDMSFTNGDRKCWDNHVQLGSPDEAVNENSANINTFYKVNSSNRQEYHKKYAGSTALQMFAYYDGKPTITEEGAMIWLSIDSAFKGHYDNRFKEVHNGYLEELGLSWMIDILDKYTYTQMNNFMLRNGMNSSIRINLDGSLYNTPHRRFNYQTGHASVGRSLNMNYLSEHLGFEVALPESVFHHARQLHRYSCKSYEFDKSKLDDSQIFSMAYTYANQIEFTTLDEF